jgi:integrase/recombinase XerD
LNKKGGDYLQPNINYELYKMIADKIIEPGLNKMEAKNQLASILDEYRITRQNSDPIYYDLRHNIKLFLKDKNRQGLSPITIDNYQLHLKIFTSRIENKPINEITKEDIVEYLDDRESDPGVNAKSTIETIRSVLRSFFEWLCEEQIIEENPMLRIKPYKVGKTIAKALTVEELELFRESCATPREKAMVETMYSTGCRLSEISALNRDDIGQPDRSIKVLGKGNKERMVFYSARAAIYLKKYLDSRKDNCEALFVTERQPSRRLSNRGIQREIAVIGKRAGIERRTHPHILRHTFATLMLNNGCPMSVLQDLLGHDDIQTTGIYAKQTLDHKHQSYDQFFHQ